MKGDTGVKSCGCVASYSAMPWTRFFSSFLHLRCNDLRMRLTKNHFDVCRLSGFASHPCIIIFRGWMSLTVNEESGSLITRDFCCFLFGGNGCLTGGIFFCLVPPFLPGLFVAAGISSPVPSLKNESTLERGGSSSFLHSLGLCSSGLILSESLLWLGESARRHCGSARSVRIYPASGTDDNNLHACLLLT